MSAEAKKFTFDVEFRPEGDLVSNAARARQKKALTQEEIDHMLTRARESGMKAGQVRAAEAIAAAIDRLCDAVRQTQGAAESAAADLREDAARLALAAGRKLASVAVSHLPEADVEEALREAMHQAVAEPRIVLRAAPAVIAALKDRLEELAQETGYDGRLVATADPAMQGADCRIEWRGGGAERSMQKLEVEIAEIIVRRFAQDPSERKG